MIAFSILFFLFGLTVVECSPTNDGAAACNRLVNLFPGKVAFPGANSTLDAHPQSTNLSALYEQTRTTYWDVSNEQDYPPCMVFPSCAQDVSTVIKVLQSFPDVPFNLKSGGHNWNRGFSSTHSGVLISFRPNMQDVVLSEDKTTAAVGPGAKWKEVMGELQKHDRCAVGGRNDDVGVGGYVVLGGISYLTGEYGFASDNVDAFEAVLADGSIVTANKTSHPDLFFALRGGGANFAIVTTYHLLAHPIGQVWGGPRIYSNDKAPQLISAIANYLTDFNESVKQSALLPTIAFPAQLNGTDIWTVFFFWDGPTPPSHLFKEFFDIPAVEDQTKIQSYPQLLNMDAFDGFAGRTTDRVGPLANLPHDNMTSFLTWHYEQAKKLPFLHDKASELVVFSMALQPIPVDLQRANAVGVPGALSVNPEAGDKMWIEYSLVWKNASMDTQLEAELAQFVLTGQAYQETEYAGIKPTKYKSGQLPFAAYNPIFANDAQAGQNVFQSYGLATFSRLKDIRKAYDPRLFFQKRMRGFHLDLPTSRRFRDTMLAEVYA